LVLNLIPLPPLPWRPFAENAFAPNEDQRAAALVGCAGLEAARIEAGFPRFGIDMDETNLPPRYAGIESKRESATI
jgi:hypothetical protein